MWIANVDRLQENSSLATEEEMVMFEIRRGAFADSRTGKAKTKLGACIWPVPWDALGGNR